MSGLPIREKGNQVKLGSVFFAMLAIVVLLVFYFYIESHRARMPDPEDYPTYNFGGGPANPSEDEIGGPQRSEKKQELINRLNNQMYQQLDMKNIE